MPRARAARNKYLFARPRARYKLMRCTLATTPRRYLRGGRRRARRRRGLRAAVAPAAGRAATRTPARVLRARCGIYWPRARDIAGMDAPQQAARSGGGAVTVTVLLKVAKMMLDVLKLLYQVVQLVYGGEMAAARDESGVEMGWGVVGV